MRGRSGILCISMALLPQLVPCVGQAVAASSDDFNACSLDRNRWTIIDPFGDGQVETVGTGTDDARLALTVPGDVAHDQEPGLDGSLRVMQTTDDADFELAVKFDSIPEQPTQAQGLVIEQALDHRLRIDLRSDGDELRLSAVVWSPGAQRVRIDQVVSPEAATHLLLIRAGNQWTVRYRGTDGPWRRAGQFREPLLVTRIGVFAANAAPTPPAPLGATLSRAQPPPVRPVAPPFTALVDYFAVAGTHMPPEDSGIPSGPDLDGDGVPSCIDGCPDDPEKVDPGMCGCNVSDVDTDEDGTADCLDGCPIDPEKTEPGTCGCGTPETDTDEDGTPDCQDECPEDPDKTSAGNCGCGAPETPECTDESGIVSDDFSFPVLDPELWTSIDPLGDATVSFTGAGTADAHLQISVPAGVSHPVWVDGNLAPRVMQDANDTDLEIEVKFESPLTLAFQNQGVIVEQDPGNFQRFDFFSDGQTVRCFAASFVNGVPVVRLNTPIDDELPMFMQVQRLGDQWIQRYSHDGASWITAATFTDAIVVSSVGVFAGNSGTDAPGHTAAIDYFFNTASPVVPEDPAAQGPPVISDIEITPAFASTRVTWTTNQPAISIVFYGQTSEYELGLVSDESLTVLHDLTIPDLLPNTLYHCQLKSANGMGSVISEDLVFSTLDPSVNVPPVAVAGSDQVLVDMNIDSVEPVLLDGSASSDLDGQIVDYAWREAGNLIAVGPTPGVTLPFGVHEIELTVTDDAQDTATDTILITVQPLPFDRATADLVALYTFGEGSGDLVLDVSGIGAPLDLTIADPVAVTWQDTGLRVDASTILNSSVAATKIVDACQASDEISVEAWITPATLDQEGPARVVSISLDAFNRNVTLAQKLSPGALGAAYETRLRTTGTDGNGLPAFESLPLVDGGRVHLVYTRNAAGQARMYFNGAEQLGGTIGGDLSNWSPSMFMALANEQEGDKPWLGEYHLVAIYSRALDPSEIAQNHDAGAGGPVIGGVQVVVGTDTAAVTWSTDVPTTSELAYGRTSDHELGLVADPLLQLEHTVVLQDLLPSTIYHYQVHCTDALGETVRSRDFVFQTFGVGGDSGPSIDTWYGPNQLFGQLGIPQVWANILGHVADLDGIASLTYQLNGGSPEPLSIGPDTRRLQDEGDFNVDLLYEELAPGLNDLSVVATDEFGNVAVSTVTVDVADDNVWPLPYSIDWSTASTIDEVAQVVDGLWALEDDTVRSVRPGYDRCIAIGDLLWTDYEAVVPITVHSLDPRGFLAPSNQPVVGLGTRWSGHLVWNQAQPAFGYTAYSALGLYVFQGATYFAIYEHPFTLATSTAPDPPLGLGVTYLWKMRVETLPGQGQFHGLKVWEEGTPEPPDWTLSSIDPDADAPLAGSLILLAHHVDATFGEVIITPIGGVAEAQDAEGQGP